MTGRKFLVRIVAWCLLPCRHGNPRFTVEEIYESLRKACPHRSHDWCLDVYADAKKLNDKKAGKRA